MVVKVFVLFLFVFAGFSEALECYECAGHQGLCTRGDPLAVRCPAEADGCLYFKYPSGLKKSCGKKNPTFACVQQKLGQRGDCIRRTAGEVERSHQECALAKVGTNGVQSPFLHEHQLQQHEEYIQCHCVNSFCNTDKFLEGDNGSGDKGRSGATGQGVGPSVVIACVVIRMSGTLLVVVLLTLGLTGSPRFAEALKCYTCTDTCNGANDIEIDCSPENNGCFISRDFEGTHKYCTKRGESFDCVQKELGQSGICYRGTEKEITTAMLMCSIQNGISSYNKMDLSSRSNTTEGNSHKLQSLTQEGSEITVCVCTENLCNTEDILESGAIGHPGISKTIITTFIFLLVFTWVF